MQDEMKYTQEDIDRMIAGLQPSVDVIDKVIAGTDSYFTEEEKKDSVDRNYRHLEIILGKEEVAEAITNAKPYTDAIKRAKNYLGIS